MKKWTICGVYEGHENAPYTDVVEAPTAEEAEQSVSRRISSLSIAGVFEGSHDPKDAGRQFSLKNIVDWTVVGILQDTDQRYCDHVEADSWMSAIDLCIAKNEHLAVASVFAGKLTAADAIYDNSPLEIRRPSMMS